MKIALFTDTYLPQKNGVAVVVNQLKYELNKLGHDVYVYTIHIPNDSKEIEDQVMRSRAVMVPKLGVDENLLALPSRSKILQHLKDNGTDIIHTHTELSQGFLGRYCARVLKIPHIHTVHTMWADYRHYLFRGRLLTEKSIAMIYHFFLRKTTAVITPSQKARDFLQYIDIKGVHINNGVDSKLFFTQYDKIKQRQLIENFHLENYSRVILFVGRLAPEKRVIDLLDLLLPVLHKYVDVAIMFIGDGIDSSLLKSKAQDSGLAKRCVFPGRVEHSEMVNYYALAYIYVTISLSEVQPMSVIEALLSGLPVISRRDSAYEDLVLNKKNGGQYESDEDVYRAIDQLLGDSISHKNYQKASLEIAKNFTSEVNASKTLRLYHQALEAGRPEAFQKGPLIYDTHSE